MKLTVKELKQAIEKLDDSDEVMVEIGGDELSYGELYSVSCIEHCPDFKLLLSCENEKEF